MTQQRRAGVTGSRSRAARAEAGAGPSEAPDRKKVSSSEDPSATGAFGGSARYEIPGESGRATPLAFAPFCEMLSGKKRRPEHAKRLVGAFRAVS